MPFAYISGAITKARNVRACLKLYEKLGELCERQNVTAFVPHVEMGYDLDNPGQVKGADEIYWRESEAVKKSDVLIAILDDPSTGAGAELQLAIDHDVSILALHHRDMRISRYIRGMLNAWEKGTIENYQNEDDLLARVSAWLSNIRKN